MWHAGSSVARGLSCPAACGIVVPQPGIKPASPAMDGGFFFFFFSNLILYFSVKLTSPCQKHQDYIDLLQGTNQKAFIKLYILPPTHTHTHIHPHILCQSLFNCLDLIILPVQIELITPYIRTSGCLLKYHLKKPHSIILKTILLE